MHATARWTCLVALIMGSVVAINPQSQAADEPENIIKYRQNVMKAIGAHITNIAAVVKGEVTYVENTALNARAIRELLTLIPDLFPEGTDTGKTNALPDIWTDRAKFDELADAMNGPADEMVAAAETNDMATIGEALGKLGKACGNCHKPFRKEL